MQMANTPYRPTKHQNVYGSRFLCQMPHGSHRWFTVKDDGSEIHPSRASWVPLSQARIDELRALGIDHDGLGRFFRTKRELLSALEGR
jgi:hypothetical protein